ncbi:hypothetical protein TNCV_1585751 [Trichonephila clavipes]|nr:hypothetical protein TNCV_1585751 [Trichonephila clavipes]
MPDGSDKDQDRGINDSVHPSVLSSSQNHAIFSSGLDEKGKTGSTAADSVSQAGRLWYPAKQSSRAGAVN